MFSAPDSSSGLADPPSGRVLGAVTPEPGPPPDDEPPVPPAHGTIHAAAHAYVGGPLCRDDLQHGSRRAAFLATNLASIAWSEARIAANLDRTLRAGPGGDVWVFAYGSLIWNPLLHFAEKRTARIYGLHRSFCLWSRIGRGTPERPGLVLGLDHGGSCAGLVYRVEAAKARDELLLMWRREMSTGAYVPTWVRARTPLGAVWAVSFVVDRSLPSYAGRMDPAKVACNIRASVGLHGPCIDYFTHTAQGLAEHGIADPVMQAVGAAVEAL
jgi:cation transport protein ChaC